MSTQPDTPLSLSPEVADAVATHAPIVALESTLLSHGLPPGRNLEVARRLEGVVREAGAVPATIAVLDGVPRVGLTDAELERICSPDAELDKLSLRDLGPTVALGRSGATTVASTDHPVPGTNVTWDVSADLGTLARTDVLVVCSGMKSILDIAATLEVLETHSVPVLGYRTDDFPAFYLRSSGHPVPHRVDDPAQAAAVVTAHRRFSSSGVLLANPIPVEHELDRDVHDRLLAEGLELVRKRGVTGSDVTPVLLEHFHTASGGASLDANEALVLSNADLAARIATELAR